METPQGTIVAMLTSFDREGKIDELEVRKLVSFLIDKGVNGIFPVSSSGEYVHLDMGERKYLIDIVIDENRGRTDIIPGTGATCYHQSIELANYAKSKGCSAVVLHGPYFFKNSDEVIEGHLRKVAESVDIPIFLYNIPFFANEITPAMAERLCQIPNVVGIKDSSGNMINIMNLIEMTRKVKPDFSVLVGSEEIYLPTLLMGGRGCMTATAGIVPEFMTGIYKAFKEGNALLAYTLQFVVLPLIREMKSVNFPQGFKEAMSIRGIEMGPPKMSYPQVALSKIADLKIRLEMEIKSLLDKYFPGTQLRYQKEIFASKVPYPAAGTKIEVKKYTDCMSCGMCNGDNNICVSKVNTQSSLNISKITDTERIEDIVSEVVKNVLKEMNN